jgi:HK97 family phage prohead protease
VLEFDGIAVPYDATIVYGGVEESFARGAFDVDAVPGTPILYGHDRGEQIGQIIAAGDTPVGLAVTGRILAATNRGGDAIALMRDGALRGLSVGFEPVEAKNTATGRQYTRALLHELSTTPLPAYGDKSTVTAVREEEEDMPDETREAIDLAPITARLDQLEARMVQRPEPAPQRVLGVVEAFTEQLRDMRDTHRIRALADVVSSGNSGVLPPAWSSEVVNYVDTMRYAFANTGRMAFPASGHTLTVPKITQSTLVGPRGTEKTEIPTQALTTGETAYTAEYFAGGVDVALEVIWQSDPSVWSLVIQDLLGQYAVATDARLTAALEGSATAVGSTLDFTSYATFSAQVIAQAEIIRANTGQTGDRLALTTASWTSLLALDDGDGRRILSTQGGRNADGSASLVASSVDVGGIRAYHNPRAAEDMQYNEKSARVAEKPPVTLTSDNVALMGRDVGVLGAIIPMAIYPDGLFVYSAAAVRSTGGKK